VIEVFKYEQIVKRGLNFTFIFSVLLISSCLDFFHLFRYSEACSACALDKDIENMKSGDLTEVFILFNSYFI